MYSKGIYVDLEGLYKVDIDIKDDYILHYGDVLFVRSSVKKEGVGWASLFAKIDEIVTFCGFIIRARVDLSKVYPEFLTYFFRTDESRRILVDGSRQVTIANINQATLSEIELLLPPLEEQKEIVRRVEKMFEKIDRMEQEYQKAAKLCDRLEQATLAKAFRGELVPQGPYDEPASVLLEQVKREKEKGKKGK
jgi:type I restriction enzyme S subunit